MTFVIGTPHTKGAGYFLDNQKLAPSQRKEADIQQCSHCETVINMQLWKDDGGFCGKCMSPICGLCADKMLTHGCTPAIREIEKAFDMTIKLDQFRRLAGLDAPPTDYRPKLLVAVGAQPIGVK
jgi:hypothetical protein